MITVEQIKAARSLLGWNQETLASRAGLSKPSLANLERRQANPRAGTTESLKKCLEEAGVEFIEGPGVRLKKDVIKVEVLKGKDSLQRLWNDIYETLKAGDERLISGADESRYVKLGDKFLKMLDKLNKKGIKGRVLCLEGTKLFPDKTSEYRWISKNLFMDTPYYVYGNKYAILIWEPEPSVVLIENKIIADTYRNQFNRHWAEAKKPRK